MSRLIVEYEDIEQLNVLTETIKWYTGLENFKEKRTSYMSSAIAKFPDGTVYIHKTPTNTIKVILRENL